MTSMEDRVYATITRTALQLDRSDREALTRAVLEELEDDLIDDDTVPDPGYAHITTGELTRTWCPHCQLSTVYQLACYTTTGDRIIRVGGIALCQECGWSPHEQEA